MVVDTDIFNGCWKKIRAIFMVDLFLYCGFILALQTSDPNWYNSLISQLTEEQRKEVEEVFKLADQRSAAAG